MDKMIVIKGARENNLKNIDVEIPREQLVILTGLSGSGKSSLAFETIYAEGQRRFMESLSAWAKRWIEQVKKPDVDSVYGLSPVISIEQKTMNKNPRSTIGTMTDISDYIRILFATAGTAHCPYCYREVPTRTAYQMAEHILSLPEGTVVEICAPVFKIYGEDLAYLFADIRTKGYRRMRIDGELYDISEDIDLDEQRDYHLEAIVDRVVVKKQQKNDMRTDIAKQVIISLQNGMRVGDGFLHFRILNPEVSGEAADSFYESFGCPEHGITMGELPPVAFSFNEVDGACLTCMGLGTYLKVHPDLLVPDKSRSIRNGAFIPDAFKYDKNTWSGRLMYSLAKHYDFSLDTSYRDLPPEVVDIVLYGSKGERFEIMLPDGATVGDKYIGKLFKFDGIITWIERRYKHYRQQQVAHEHMETYLKKVMVEHSCPDCRGTKLKHQRLLVTMGGKNIHQAGEMTFSELREYLEQLPLPPKQQQAGKQIIHDITARLDLLLGIGLDYLNLNRRAMTLSGGESQRIRLSTQIGSGLMGMLYVLDEPSIGLHPKDNFKMIQTLRRLRDIGNSVIVVEHDEETIRAADHILEIGPGPGQHGGQVVAQGSVDEILENTASLTGQYLSGRRKIPLPENRRQPTGQEIVVRGASENNLKNIDVHLPLGVLICITGVSGSGKSTLVNEILYKKLYSIFHDSRVLSGMHAGIEGVEHIHDVIDIDQTPIGRSPRSNPATYIGFYDEIRRIFAETPEAVRRGYTPSRFSFNVKGGRCEECGGEGLITTQLQFMPDVEVECYACKGRRYNEETLEIEYKGKNIAEVLDMPFEEAAEFFKDNSLIAYKIKMLNELGLGYLRLGQSSTTLSGGEAQRVKLATELSKIKRGGKNLYILDEPTTGLHLADIQSLLDSLNRLVDAGNTVLVIEHHLDIIKTADHVIDLGPEGGARGGEIVVEGTPEEVARHPYSYTGKYLSRHLHIEQQEPDTAVA